MLTSLNSEMKMVLNRFDPIVVSENIKQSYMDYITSFCIADKEYANELQIQLEKEGFVAK